jgi:hypothetical protein
LNSHFYSNNPDASPGLFYIYRSSTENNFENQTDNHNIYNMNNVGYITDSLRDDQPPNYYEAIKNRVQQNVAKTTRAPPNIFRLTSNENVASSRDNIELAARSSVSSRSRSSSSSSSRSESEQNLAQNSINETISSSSYDNEVIIMNSQSIQSNSAHSNQMTAFINISESGDESINSSSQTSDV